MNLQEYEKIKGFTYLEYCDYLQKKYGIGINDYMTKDWGKNRDVSRTKEGLVAHHLFEDHAIMLSHIEYAKKNPYEWQLAKNIVYCDYLEHLLLHILICQDPSEEKNKNEEVGVGGVINYIVPELNDLYSGWQPAEEWKIRCFNIVKNDKKVYLTLIERFKVLWEQFTTFEVYYYMDKELDDFLYSSFNEKKKTGLWSRKQNEKIFKEIAAL